MTDDRDARFDRRRFVKGMAAAGAAGAALAAGHGIARGVAQNPCETTRLVRYVGARKVQGPAPRALPLLPVEAGDDGVLRGRPTFAGEPTRDWYRYCGHEDAPGLQPGWGGDDVLRYALPGGGSAWFDDRLGEPVRADELRAGAGPASVAWRSQGVPEGGQVTAVVLAVDPEAVALEGVDPAGVRDAGLAEGLLAVVSFCTHFCCTPRWRAPSASPSGTGDVHCSCHGSVYDPFTLTRDRFVLCEGAGEPSPLKPGSEG